jgi:two-component system NtrC family sensor kinase
LTNKDLRHNNPGNTCPVLIEEIKSLTHQILEFANQGIPRVVFLREVAMLLADFARCNVLELWLNENNKYIHCVINGQSRSSFQYEVLLSDKDKNMTAAPHFQSNSILDSIRLDVIRGRFDPANPNFTSQGSFWTGDLEKYMALLPEQNDMSRYYDSGAASLRKSLALIPIAYGDNNMGLLEMSSLRTDYFDIPFIELFEGITQTLAIALTNQRSQAALQERVKELSCMYSIAKIRRRDLTIKEILQSIANLLPPAWQYPDITAAMISLDSYSYSTPGFKYSSQKQVSNIVIKDKIRGSIEIVYLEKMPELDEGPFLKEERKLIDAITRQIGLIIERKETDEERLKLQDQLRHADRLATIGQVAAGVAHELNEPLASILGFAQLINKTTDLSGQVNDDINKIISASLHAREVIKKLMIFSRQMPSRSAHINLNQVVEDGLYFFEARCARAGIELVRSLKPNIPEINGDPSQLNQVLINLVVNSIQAMPEGGRLLIKTDSNSEQVFLIVEDTGYGIAPENMKKIFNPFFTTKDINEGTGLGLAVVHGIVASHNGAINVDSVAGQGAKFQIQFPVFS